MFPTHKFAPEVNAYLIRLRTNAGSLVSQVPKRDILSDLCLELV